MEFSEKLQTRKQVDEEFLKSYPHKDLIGALMYLFVKKRSIYHRLQIFSANLIGTGMHNIGLKPLKKYYSMLRQLPDTGYFL